MSKHNKTISTHQLMKQFPDEKSAIAHLEKIRWGAGHVCPHCHEKGKAGKTSNKRVGSYRCKSCRKEYTVRHGTIFERSRIPLHKWMYGMYILQTARKGISSLLLSKELGITQKSAWFMLYRLREACSVQAIKLNGIVEADETCIGGKKKNKRAVKRIERTRGRSTKTKTAVSGMKQRGGKVKTMAVKKTDKETMHKAAKGSTERGSRLYTDDATHWKQCVEGYPQETVNYSAKEYVLGMAHINGNESVWAVLKRGYNGICHNFSKKHMQGNVKMQGYVNEFSFGLNDGSVDRDTQERSDSLIAGSIGKRITYSKLIS